MQLLEFPDEVIQLIACCTADVQHVVLPLSSTCTALRRLLHADQHMWQQLWARHFPDESVPAVQVAEEAFAERWKWKSVEWWQHCKVQRGCCEGHVDLVQHCELDQREGSQRVYSCSLDGTIRTYDWRAAETGGDSLSVQQVQVFGKMGPLMRLSVGVQDDVLCCSRHGRVSRLFLDGPCDQGATESIRFRKATLNSCLATSSGNLFAVGDELLHVSRGSLSEQNGITVSFIHEPGLRLLYGSRCIAELGEHFVLCGNDTGVGTIDLRKPTRLYEFDQQRGACGSLASVVDPHRSSVSVASAHRNGMVCVEERFPATAAAAAATPPQTRQVVFARQMQRYYWQWTDIWVDKHKVAFLGEKVMRLWDRATQRELITLHNVHKIIGKSVCCKGNNMIASAGDFQTTLLRFVCPP